MRRNNNKKNVSTAHLWESSRPCWHGDGEKPTCTRSMKFWTASSDVGWMLKPRMEAACSRHICCMLLSRFLPWREERNRQPIPRGLKPRKELQQHLGLTTYRAW